MSSSRIRLGRSSEIAAAEALGKSGYKIITSNWRCRAGEIDFIAKDEDTLVFVEVRSKSTTSYGTPEESITIKKQQHLLSAANKYLLDNNIVDTDCRFDVVCISLENSKVKTLEIIKNAFW